MSKAWRIFFLGSLLFCSPLLLAQTSLQILNLAEITKDLNLKAFKGKTFNKKIKVAILDNGFYGYENEVGKTLPKDTVYHASAASEADKIDNRGFHGLFMAQLFNQVIRQSEAHADVELHLFYAYGYTKLADAIDVVIKEKFDVVLYSQVWEYGGNGDGKGFINTLVNKALDAGVLWINASGNYGRLTRLAPVDGKMDGKEEFVHFKDEMKVKVDCAPKKGERCSLRLVLSWNDFKDDSETGTDKDLDLYLYDSKKRLVDSSERHQKLVKDLEDKMASMVPRELIETKVDPGTYLVKVKIKSKNFSPSQDQLRITATGLGVEITAPSLGETLLPPADNARVIVVGASDDLQSDRSLKNSKPDIWLKSLVRLKDGSNPFSTSNAAAMAAGLTVLNLGTGTEATFDAVIAKLKPVSRTDQAANKKEGLKEPPQDKPRARQRRENVSQGGSLPYMYPAVRRLLKSGANIVRVDGRAAIVVGSGVINTSTMDDDQMPFMTPEGIRFLGPEDWQDGLPADHYEIIISK